MTSKKLHLLPLALPVLGSLQAADVTAVLNNGDWLTGATWSDGAIPTAANNYVVPTGIGIDGYTGANVTANTTLTFPGAGLSIQDGGSLYLDGGHNSSYPDWTYNITALTLQNNGSLHFRGGAGTDFFLTNGFNVGGVNSTVAIRHSAGSYDQRARLGPITGPAGSTIQILATHNPSNGGTYAKDNYAISANSSYAGNWFLDYTVAAAGKNVRLRADAANALGTGTVTLGRLSVLENGIAGGFDSLAGIVLQDSTSTVNFGPGWTSAAGTLDLAMGTATLGAGTGFGTASFASLNHGSGILQFDLGTTPANSDKVVLSGNYNAGELSPIDVRLTADPGSQTFDLVTYAGNLTGTVDPLVVTKTRLEPHFTFGDGSNDKIRVSFTGSTANLVWKGNDSFSPNAWDIDSTSNFENAGVPDRFLTIDSVTFDDSAATFTPSLATAVVPRSVTINNSTNPYTFSGAGSIAGTTGLTKSGSAAATISTANTFTGNVAVNGGTLLLGNAGALGTTGTKQVTVASGAALDFNGISPGTTRAYNYSIAGSGSGAGALINSSATSVGANSGIQNLTLAGNATIGGAGRFDIGRIGSASGIITGNGHTLTKIGANQIQLRGDASATPLSIQVNEGILGMEDHDGAFGGATGSVTVATGAKLGSYGARTIATPVTLNAGSTLYNQGGAASIWSGAITLAGDATIEANGQAVTTNAIGGTGKLTKTGNNTLILNGSRSGAAGSELVLGNLRAMVNDAFGSGTVTVAGVTGTGQTRVELQGVTVPNNFVLNSAAQTGFTGPLSATGGVASTVNGTVTVSAGVGNGGHLAAVGAGSVLRLNGELIVTNNVVPNVRVGIVELGGGGTYPRLDQGEGTIRLAANNGISTAAQLRLAVSAAGTLDLNGFNQTLSQINRAATAAATVTNAALTPSVLTINGATDHEYKGTINDGTGGISLVKNGTSVLNLTGASTYTGATTINGGTLKINAAHGIMDLSPVTVNASGTLGGIGPVNGEITVAGTLAPGNSAGTLLTYDTVTFAPGSRYAWEVADWTGTVAGTAWDLIDARELALTATTGNKLTIAISGDAANFSESAKSFEIARSVDPITGFNAAAIQIDDSAFVGVGTWSVQVSGTSVNLVYSAGSGTPYSNWAAANGIAGATADQDSDGDGIANGIEFVLGGDPSGPNSASNSLLPTITTDATHVNFTFRRTDESAVLDPYVQYTTTLTGTWTDAQTGVNGVLVQETNNGFGTGVDSVTVKIPRTLASGGKLFARLRVEAP